MAKSRQASSHSLLFNRFDTDQIYPGCYLALTDPKEIGSHCLAGVSTDIAPDFPQGGSLRRAGLAMVITGYLVSIPVF